jgi:hypothetical protein
MTRAQITAQGTPMIATPHLVGSLHTQRPPMSEARRNEVHGPIRSLDEQARAIGEPPLWVGVLLILTIVIAAWAAIVAFTPATSSAPSEARVHSADASEVGVGDGEG